MASEHRTSVEKMGRSNPFYEEGYRWEWSCSCGQARGGAVTREEAVEGAARHLTAEADKAPPASKKKIEVFQQGRTFYDNETGEEVYYAADCRETSISVDEQAREEFEEWCNDGADTEYVLLPETPEPRVTQGATDAEKASAQQVACVEPEPDVIVNVTGGIAEVVSIITPGLHVEVRDYDNGRDMVEGDEGCSVDEGGFRYSTSTYDGPSCEHPPIVLTARDWAEIFYALDSKIGSDTTEPGPDLEGDDWRGHLKAIMERIGEDGQDAFLGGVLSEAQAQVAR